MNLTAVVLHNVGVGMFWQYNPDTAELYHAHNFTIEADGIERAADLVFTLANVGSPEDLHFDQPTLSRYVPQVRHYRQRMNRSLSVGDVIVFSEGERPAGSLAVAPLGFEPLTTDPEFAGPASNAGEHSAAYLAHADVIRTQRTPGGRSLRL